VRGPIWLAVAPLLLVAALVLPGLAAGASLPPTPSSIPTLPTRSGGALLPAALSASWAARTGYVASVHLDGSWTAPATGPVSVFITLWPQNLSIFAPRPVGAPALTAAQSIEEYSPPVAEYGSVLAYFQGYGLSVVHTWPDRLSLTVTGSAQQVGAAFGTTLFRGSVGGSPVLFPSSVPRLPGLLESEISSVSGLSSGFSHLSFSLGPVAPSLRPSASRGSSVGTTQTEVTPSGVHGAYGVDALYNLSGTFHSAVSQKIVLLLWGDGYAPSDISTFFQQYYPSEYPVTPTVNAYPIDGAPAPSASAVNDPSGGPQELTLDIEWSGSMAPGATLDAVYAPDGPPPTYSPNDTPMEDALSYAVNSIPGVTTISMSFGLPEAQDLSFQAAYSTLFAAASSQGITLLGASGDNGGSTYLNGSCTTTAEVEFPASSPQVVAVGGTQPTLNVGLGGGITGIASEPAWNRSGGGLSISYPAPSWQLVGSAGSVIGSGGRGVPDVAGPAADNLVYFNGQAAQLAGTSFSTPMWAGLVAEMNAIRGAPFGFLTPRLYALAASEEAGGSTHAFSDVTSGGNCLYPARAGWDLATGWGSPHPLVLYAALTSTFVNLSVTPSPVSIFPGGSTIVSVEVRNGSSGQPLAGLPVSLTFGAPSSYNGPCGGAFQSATVVTDAQGAAQARLSVPLCYLGGQAVVAALLLSGGFFGQATTNVMVSLLSGSGFIALISEYPYNVIFFALLVVIAALIGAVVSRRRRPRTGPYRPPPLTAAVPSGATTGWTPAPSAPPGSPSPASSYGGWTGPSRAPAAPTPSPPPSPEPSAVRCPACGTLIPMFSLSCPKCGLARP
jgi:kumamolisin